MSKSKTVAKTKLSVDLEETKKAAAALRALTHKKRQQILSIIDANGEMMVSSIYARLKMEQSLTSSYLALLRKAGVVKTRREGQSIFYSVDHEKIAEITKGAKMINA